MRVSQFCFLAASLAAVIGVSLGIFMGISEDHSLAPVHVHLNLVGFVSLFLFGLYYHAHPASEGRLAMVQAASVSAGVIVMMAGLAALIVNQHPAALPAAVAGSLLVWLGMALFAFIAWRDVFARRPAETPSLDLAGETP
jgi:hypothetical protein